MIILRIDQASLWFRFHFMMLQVEGQPLCSIPNVCPLTTAELPGETIRLHTCGQCPSKYPWLLDPEGAGFSG